MIKRILRYTCNAHLWYPKTNALNLVDWEWRMGETNAIMLVVNWIKTQMEDDNLLYLP